MLSAVSDTKLDHLKHVMLFSRSSHRELEFLASQTDEVEAPAGAVLIRQGQPNDTFYMLLDGEADVEVDGSHRRIVSAGDFFGEISMLDRGPATATVTLKTPAKLMVMSHAQFRDAIKSNDHLLTVVLTAVAERLRATSTPAHDAAISGPA